MVHGKILCSLAAAIAVSLVLAAPTSADVVRIGIAPKSTASFGIAERAARIASDEIGSRGNPRDDATAYVVIETGGVVDNLRRLDRGQVDAALVSLSALRTGGGASARNLRVLEFIVVAPQVVYATEESGLTSIEQLDGRAVIAGNAGSGTESTTREVFELLGIEPNWVRMASDQVAGAIRERQAVAFVKAMGSPDAAEDIDIIHGYLPLRQLEFPPGREAVLRERAPSLRLVPYGPGSGRLAWADPMAIVASAGMAQVDAALYAKALRTVLAEMGVELRGLAPADLPDIVFHPGAVTGRSGAGTPPSTPAPAGTQRSRGGGVPG